MTPHVKSAMNPDQSATDAATPRDKTRCVKERLAAVAWVTVLLPPLTLLASIGLGAYVNSLSLGERGFVFVIVLIGPGAWAIALTCAAGVVALLAQGSVVTRIALWSLEIALCLFAYSLVSPLLGGWS